MSDQSRISIVLVDDHSLLREALREKLAREPDFDVVGDAGSAGSALTMVAEMQPDVLILDITLPDQSGVEVAEAVRRLAPDTRIIAFSMHDEQHMVTAMLRAGAMGYVTKTADRPSLLNAIRAVASGNEYLSPEASATLVRTLADSRSELTPREQEVLQLLAEGRRSPEIAALLSISSGTVDVHRRNIMAKLDLHSIAELTRYAIREGIISP